MNIWFYLYNIQNQAKLAVMLELRVLLQWLCLWVKVKVVIGKELQGESLSASTALFLYLGGSSIDAFIFWNSLCVYFSDVSYT